MKIACVADIHGMYNSPNWPIKWPEADVLVLAGDILKNYSQDCTQDALQQLNELEHMNDWLPSLPYDYVLFVAGNHDWVFQIFPEARDVLTNALYIQDEYVWIDGLKFYGSPWQPWFYDWAFNFPCPHKAMGGNHARAMAHARNRWRVIPHDTDVLITHGPPKGTLDLTYSKENVGCPWLRDRIEKLDNLKAHIFGHIHYSRGITGTKPMYVNAAICTEMYRPRNKIQVINV